MATRKSRSKKVVAGHGRPKRKDGKPYRGTCRKCGRDHRTSAHWSHAKGPKGRGPRGGTSYKTTRAPRPTTGKAPSFARSGGRKVSAAARAKGMRAFARAFKKGTKGGKR